MSKKMIIGLLSLVLFASTTYAAREIPSKVSATMMIEKDVQAKKHLESMREAAGKDYTKLSPALKTKVNAAIDYYSAKVNVKSASLRSLAMRNPDILVTVVRLEQVMQSGTPEQKKLAEVQIRLIDVGGSRIALDNYQSKEVQAMEVMMSLDILTLPHAAPVVTKIVDQLANNPDVKVQDAIKIGMTGMKGTIDDFINFCRDGKA